MSVEVRASELSTRGHQRSNIPVVVSQKAKDIGLAGVILANENVDLLTRADELEVVAEAAVGRDADAFDEHIYLYTPLLLAE